MSISILTARLRNYSYLGWPLWISFPGTYCPPPGPSHLQVSGSLGATAPQLLWFCFLHSHMYTFRLYAV